MGNAVRASICIDDLSHWKAASFQENRVGQAEVENISFTCDKQACCFYLQGVILICPPLLHHRGLISYPAKKKQNH